MTQLSDEAIHILQLASSTGDDSVILVNTLSGTTLQVGDRDVLDGLDPRKAAKYRSAINELVRERLLEDRAGKGEVFFLTGPGYDMAEQTKAP